VYGPRETSIRDLFVAASRGVVPVLAGGKPRIQLVYVGDLARAVVGALRRGGRNETFYVAHPEVLDYRQIARRWRRFPQKALSPVPPFLPSFFFLLPGDGRFDRGRLSSIRKADEICSRVVWYVATQVSW
jgi:nucleoside-diphosphate-sugar epimerase